MEVLEPAQWRAAMQRHQERADDRLSRYRHAGGYHPVFDFLFEYYPVRPSHLRRWHPGFGFTLAVDGGEPAPHAQWRDYHRTDQGINLDLAEFWARRGESVTFMRDFLCKSAENPTSFDCFGLHEWAMVYRTEQPRHSLPLRLGARGTDTVVESHRIKCTHFDAYRFFTEPARPLNLTVLSRERQPADDQCGCVHATMDLYKWAWKLGPLIPGELFLDCFDIAVQARILDMEASPYDCRDLGLGVVAIETPEGKAEYVHRQRALSAAAKPLRSRLVSQIDRAYAATLDY
ncbi:3-methyladenine DNA glycosylase [Corynebacterium flavescens]|uniref:3-methyladenine DNA glycosylase n=1 Tax=Corynebacterium flavescens TaxID=28028 RepID=UPI003F932A3C